MRIVNALISGLLLLAAGLSAVRAGEPRHDVSYVWHPDLGNVYTYQDRVIRALGPGVAERLRVVEKPGFYGLIYDVAGSSASAYEIARVHTDRLRRHGLLPAAVVPAERWHTVGSLPASGATAPAVARLPQSPARRTKSIAKTSAGTGNDPAIADLEAAVERHIKSLRRQGRIAADEKTAWSVYDFTTGRKLVSINEDQRFQGASLVKPFFALAYFDRVEAGLLRYDAQSKRHMERMIQRSDNQSTNWVIKRVGGPSAVQKILRGRYGSMFEDTRIVEYIPANGRTYRNQASAHDYSRFLYALWNNSLPGAAEIKRLMRLPGRDRIYTGANAIPRGAVVYNKTGSTSRLCGDMGILEVTGRDGRRYAYTLVGIIEKRSRASNYTAWIRSRGDVIRSVSNIVYRGISHQHGLNRIG